MMPYLPGPIPKGPPGPPATVDPEKLEAATNCAAQATFSLGAGATDQAVLELIGAVSNLIQAVQP
jgi:hypothetical protein